LTPRAAPRRLAAVDADVARGGQDDLWVTPRAVHLRRAAVAGWLAIALLLWADLPYLVLPLSAGFFFVGPFMAVGLYEISRRLEAALPVDGRSTWRAWRRNPDQIALMGVLLLLLHLAWMRAAQLLFALFEWPSVPSWDRFMDLAWHSARSLPFLAVGVALGAVLAAGPSHRRILDALSARPARRQPVRGRSPPRSLCDLNVRPMVLWASLIVVLWRSPWCRACWSVVVLPVVGRELARLPRHRFEPGPPLDPRQTPFGRKSVGVAGIVCDPPGGLP
jgi:hypothetical protein